MKKLFLLLAVAIATSATVFAQDAKDLAKQKKELNEINMKLLNAKPSKDARKQEKALLKEGWQVPAGSKTIAKQITETQLLGEELMDDEVGSPVKRYIIRSAQAVSGTYNTGMAAARNNPVIRFLLTISFLIPA